MSDIEDAEDALVRDHVGGIAHLTAPYRRCLDGSSVDRWIQKLGELHRTLLQPTDRISER